MKAGKHVIQVGDINIGRNTQNPTVSLLYECCRILGCDMNKLFLISADN